MLNNLEQRIVTMDRIEKIEVMRSEILRDDLRKQGITSLTYKLIDWESYFKEVKERATIESEKFLDNLIANKKLSDSQKKREFEEYLDLMKETEDELNLMTIEKTGFLFTFDWVFEIKLGDFTKGELDLLSDENKDLFVRLVREFPIDITIGMLLTQKNTIGIYLTMFTAERGNLPKLSFNSLIEKLKEKFNEAIETDEEDGIYSKQSIELLNEMSDRFGIFDFKKLETEVNQKFDEEFNELQKSDKITLEDVTRLRNKFMVALSIVETHDPSKEEFSEMFFVKEQVFETFEWLGKEPSDFLIQSMRFDKSFFDGFFALVDSDLKCDSLDCLVHDLTSKFKSHQIMAEFMIDCYLTYRVGNIPNLN
jgi:uncharacterized protein YlxP (DUF503 family)